MARRAQRMIPLRVTAELSGPICLPDGLIALDSLLASQVALRQGLMALDAQSCVEIEIPVQRSECGRFHLCSHSVCEAEAHEKQFTNKRPAIEQFQAFGNEKLRRVDIATGPNKGYRIPRVATHLRGDRIDWWCVGDREQIKQLLSTVTHLGKKRGVGLGRVARWIVDPCEPWYDGFPVVLHGKPMRPLPANYPGLENPRLEYRTLSYPYWDHSQEDLIAYPGGA